MGAGEIILNSIDRDGTMQGYDLSIYKNYCSKLNIPTIASGGAGKITDLVEAIESGASAVAAGSLFIYQGIYRAVLISYIKSEEIDNLLKNK